MFPGDYVRQLQLPCSEGCGSSGNRHHKLAFCENISWVRLKCQLQYILFSPQSSDSHFPFGFLGFKSFCLLVYHFERISWWPPFLDTKGPVYSDPYCDLCSALWVLLSVLDIILMRDCDVYSSQSRRTKSIKLSEKQSCDNECFLWLTGLILPISAVRFHTSHPARCKWNPASMNKEAISLADMTGRTCKEKSSITLVNKWMDLAHCCMWCVHF